ncbi:hypothetical protein DIX60_08925 [Streptococcus iniae]|uniref:hypothetical protein n=1 Tax=Streptococcus iniae TaxID=1346 RepID=UPI000EF6F771|nr:hypothetical protein [Streptococcus iniae]RLV27092.1 hypothetical protein DIX60_08925 [Streptococcus iniae]
MLVRIGQDFCEVPQVYSFRFKDKKHLLNMSDTIRQHLVEVWGAYSPSEVDYGYDFICNAIEDEQWDSQFINNCIVDYINRGSKSVCTLEQFVTGVHLSEGRIELFDSTVTLIYQNLLVLYNEEIQAFEEDFLEKEAVKLLIEIVFLDIALWIKADYYYSVKEFVDVYNNLVFNEFYDKEKKLKLNLATVRNIVSKLKKNPLYEDSIINFNGKNYLGKKVRTYVENDVPSFKKLYENSRLAMFNEECQQAFTLINKQKNYIINSYQIQLCLEDKGDENKWSELLDNYCYKRLFVLIEINVVLLILDDVLDSLNNKILIEEFQKYEISFWNRFKDINRLYKREDFQKLYYSILSFVFLYIHRIRMGAMSYAFFEQLGNVNADIQLYINKARESFKGTKNKAVFSKRFKKFLTASRGDYERILSNQNDWKAIRSFIQEHLKATEFTFEYGQIEQNLDYSNDKNRDFSKKLLTFFNEKIENAEKKISSLNIDKEDLNITSWIGGPPDEYVNLDEGIMIGHFKNKIGNKELGKIQNGEYSKTTFDELTHPDFAPEFRYTFNKLFNRVAYKYKIKNSDTLIEEGIIYFYDLDGRCGRYKLFPNEERPEIESEQRYGRFEYWTLGGRLELTGNGLTSCLGKQIIIHHFMDSQSFEITKRLPYSKQLGANVWFEFEKVII